MTKKSGICRVVVAGEIARIIGERNRGKKVSGSSVIPAVRNVHKEGAEQECL